MAASQDQLQLTTSRVEPQQSSTVIAKQPFKIHPGMITKLFGAKRLTATTPQIICPDGYTLCPSNNTCCLNRSLDYDCCPFVDGVCCSDQEHCCPLGYSCNSDGTCTQQHVVCPHKSFCPLKNICCLLASGKYNCCPTPYGHGSCCAVGEHCCALGYSCNGDNTCKQTGIVCPSQKNACPLDNTCCPLDSGDYGCCPLPNAVCCSGEKCCPSGNTCNSNGTCSHSEEDSPSADKQPIKESIRPTIDAIIVKSVAATLMKQPPSLKHLRITSAPMEASVHQITPVVRAHREDMAAVHCNMLPAVLTVNTDVPWATHVMSVLTHVHVSTLYVLTRIACAHWIPHAACTHRESIAAVSV